MSNPNWKGINKGLDLDNLSDLIVSMILGNKKRKAEQQKIEEDRTAAKDLINTMPPDATPQQRMETLLNAPQGYQGAMKYYFDMLDEQSKPAKQPNVSHLDFSSPDVIRGWNQDENKPWESQGNPFWKPKLLRSDTFYDDNGQEQIRFFYDDPKYDTQRPTGGKKSSEKKEKADEFDDTKFQKNISSWSNNLSKLNTQQTFTEGEKSAYNTEMLNNEQEIYSYAEKVDEYFDKRKDTTLSLINEYYAQLRKAASTKGMTPEQYENLHADDLKKTMEDYIAQRLKKGQADFSVARLAKLWLSFKLGYKKW